MKEGHLAVLAEEVIETLAPQPGSLQIDATVGGGGHTERILEATSPDGRLLGLDLEPRADLGRHVGIRCFVQVDVADTLQVADHRHARFLLNSTNEVLAASRHHHVDPLRHR